MNMLLRDLLCLVFGHSWARGCKLDWDTGQFRKVKACTSCGRWRFL